MEFIFAIYIATVLDNELNELEFYVKKLIVRITYSCLQIIADLQVLWEKCGCIVHKVRFPEIYRSRYSLILAVNGFYMNVFTTVYLSYFDYDIVTVNIMIFMRYIVFPLCLPYVDNHGVNKIIHRREIV